MIGTSTRFKTTIAIRKILVKTFADTPTLLAARRRLRQQQQHKHQQQIRFKRNMLLLHWRLFALMSLCSICIWAKEAWLRPGCHKVGNTRKISIPDCVEFRITTNACRGFCESYAVPGLPWSAMLISGSGPGGSGRVVGATIGGGGGGVGMSSGMMANLSGGALNGGVMGMMKAPKPVVSVGQCCNMIESEEVQKRVLCMGGMRNFTFKSAVSCSCYHCKKD